MRLMSLTFGKEETRKVISKLNNEAAVGPDGIPTQCYKYGGSLVVTAMTDIAGQSLQENEIPSLLKHHHLQQLSSPSLSVASSYLGNH